MFCCGMHVAAARCRRSLTCSTREQCLFRRPCAVMLALMVALGMIFVYLNVPSAASDERFGARAVQPVLAVALRAQAPYDDSSPGNWSERIQPVLLSGAANGALLRDVCVGRNQLEFMPSSREDAEMLTATRSFCCGNRSLVTKRRRRAPCQEYGPLLCLEYSLYRMTVSVAPFHAHSRPALLPGRSYLMDTAVVKMQFGHLAAKFLQFFGLDEAFDDVIFNRVDRLPGWPIPPGARTPVSFDERHIGTLLNWTVAERSVPLYTVPPSAAGRVCAQSAFVVLDYERLFHRSTEAGRWRQLVKTKLGLELTQCPPPRAAILLRSESFARGFVQLDVIDRVAARHGITRVDRVTINSSNDTRQHAELFAGYGLLLSGHSSQLKNLMFSHPHTAVIEIVGRYLQDRASAFQRGTEELGLIYHASQYHTANWTLCGRSCTQPNDDKNAKLTLNETSLDAAFATVLAAQWKACPDLAYQ